ncbi:MAG: DDE-type integrase/transposase/recombinase, partial [Bdellovibrionales bacterium]
LEQRREVVQQYLVETKNINRLCKNVELVRSSFYYKKETYKDIKRGRPIPGYTVNRDGSFVLDTTIVNILTEYRKDIHFMTAVGAKSLSRYIAAEKNIYINHKKIYRLCDENNLLLFKQNSTLNRKQKKKRCEFQTINGPNQLWQFDIKYGYIHGEQKYFFLLAFIDVYTKKIVGYFIGKSCKADDLVFTLQRALKSEQIKSDQKLIIRSDNGTQMTSNKFFFYLKRLEQKLQHEFIPPRTPNRNAYIESFF